MIKREAVCASSNNRHVLFHCHGVRRLVDAKLLQFSIVIRQLSPDVDSASFVRRGHDAKLQPIGFAGQPFADLVVDQSLCRLRPMELELLWKLVVRPLDIELRVVPRSESSFLELLLLRREIL